MRKAYKQFTKVLCIGLITVGALPANAIVRLGDLGPLELKFFAHQYDRETPAERLDRLEKLVFGGVQTGSIEERVAKISQTVQTSTPEKPVTANSSKKEHTVTTSSPQSNQSNSQPDLGTANYPRVSELERSLLGRTYVGEPVRQRLGRLETKAYGAPSRVEDLAVRVDKLTSYAGVYGMQPGDSMGGTSESLHGLAGFDSTSQTRSVGMLERVSAMEVKVFGHENSNRALVRRIKDLESSVLGSVADNPNEDMTTRVNQLWAKIKPASGGASSGGSSPSSQSAQSTPTLQPFSSPSYAGQQYNGYQASPYMANNPSSSSQYGSTQSKHKNKGQHSSFLGKIGKVVAFAGTAAVGAGGLAVGAMGSMGSMGSMNMGYYGMGMGSGFGSIYPSSYRSYAPSYGSVSSISSFGNMSTGSFFNSPYNSSYAGSFFSP
ncbi:MAG: hypothetical protein JST89_23025 [Cyanobacteria bacterium SZAS-4]|nr:hypothetical protein [Cyanobacteria bacterium SZAS-4]